MMDTKRHGLEGVVSAGAELERIATGFEFLEGPIWHPYDHHLIFSDIIGDAQYLWDENDGVRLFRRPSHMANGNTYDRQGRVVTCEHATSRVTRTAFGQEYEVLASHYQGRELNSPNDIVVAMNGTIYFSDPTSGRTEKFGVPRPQQLSFQGVYRIDPADGHLTLLVDDFSKPNGLCFSLDEKRLFINDTDRQHIRVFDVDRSGLISGGEVWAEVGGDLPGVADGMKVDQAGNLYCCGSGGIHVFDSEGARLGIIETGEFAANFTWGGEDLRDLLITATGSVYRRRMDTPGRALF